MPMNRRDAIATLGGGFGAVGLLSAAVEGPLSPRAGHFAGKAKHVIFLFLNGGLSQVDTFDPKPALDKYHGTPMPGGNPKTERTTGNLMRSPFRFQKHGQSGLEVSEIFPQVGGLIDHFAVLRSVHTNVPIHESSLFMMNCGDLQAGRPSMGSWITYGLGTANQNLPGYVVLCPGVPVVGPPLWNSAFLPAAYQGTHLTNKQSNPKEMIPFLAARSAMDRQRRQLDLLAELNRKHMLARNSDARLAASIHSMEVAYRMQTEAPEVFDIAKEPERVRAAYGESEFGRGCLMARRMVERGVRVVQIYHGNAQPWDNHEDIQVHRKLAGEADPAIAALLTDLKERGLLGETLLVIGGEFGRTPSVENSAAVKLQNGRDHNPYGFTMLMAGGGVKGGMAHGATDDFGFRAQERRVHIHDLHATMLHLLGLDHKRLTYRYSGRDFRLTDVAGEVIQEILG
ncbi:MAG: DUF1501 domain-containing protein [Bryobacterales bacterium]|nr:DUF1501 domain-containing protein [Bryobacterales bacterium]